MIIHLGMKPERGGRPPSDSINMKVSEVIRGSLLHVWDNGSVVVDVFYINNMNVVSVFMMSTVKLRIIIGLYILTAAIHSMGD